MGKKKIDYKKEYAGLLGSGMFWEWFPQLTGTWDDDKDSFIEIVKDWQCFKDREKK